MDTTQQNQSKQEAYIPVLESFANLWQTICELNNKLKKLKSPPMWLAASTPSSSKDTPPIEQLCSLLQALQYQDDQKPRQTIIAPGFIGVSQDVISAALEVNQAKQNFKASILQLKSLKLKSDTNTISRIMQTQRHINVSQGLKTMSLARLHLKQCYREIVILNTRPDKITWTWANVRSIKKINTDTAIKMLQKKCSDYGIEQQLEKVYQLPKDTPLAVVQELAPHLRANIVYRQQHETTRQMVKGPMPIFFPQDQSLIEKQGTPEFKPIKSEPEINSTNNSARQERSDQKINPNVFLPAIRAHLYLE